MFKNSPIFLLLWIYCLLQGVKIPAYSYRLPHGSQLGCTNGAHIEVKKRAKLTPWPEPASELYRPSDSYLLAKLVPTFMDRGVVE
jgi:hypothetical protein